MLPPAAAGPWVESRRRGPCLQIAAQLAAMRADGGGAPGACRDLAASEEQIAIHQCEASESPGGPGACCFQQHFVAMPELDGAVQNQNLPRPFGRCERRRAR
jgi:hypothetical protein